jgi:Flp pilus assembly pilin Flp
MPRQKSATQIAIAGLYLLRQIINQEDGQDLVEYALVIAMVSLLAIAVLANGINGGMMTLSTRLNGAVA